MLNITISHYSTSDMFYRQPFTKLKVVEGNNNTGIFFFTEECVFFCKTRHSLILKQDLKINPKLKIIYRVL